jgi:hypothetical protein
MFRLFVPDGDETKLEKFIFTIEEILNLLSEFKYFLVMFILWGILNLFFSLWM